MAIFLQVEELVSLDTEDLRRLAPVYGLIFLFSYEEADANRGPVVNVVEPHADLFFARQMIRDACATQAILAVLLNSPDLDKSGSLGPMLANFKDFAKSLPPDMKGLAISGSEEIRAAHNSFKAPDDFIVADEDKRSKDGEAFHFVAYVPFKGKIYELDGLRDGPIYCGDCDAESWTDNMVPLLERNIRERSKEKFNLMAIIKDRRQCLQADLDRLTAARVAETDGDRQAALAVEEETARTLLAEEEEKRISWREENIRRRHNYFPLIYQMLRAMAERDMLKPLVDKVQGFSSNR